MLAFYGLYEQCDQAVDASENWLKVQAPPASEPEPLKAQLDRCRVSEDDSEIQQALATPVSCFFGYLYIMILFIHFNLIDTDHGLNSINLFSYRKKVMPLIVELKSRHNDEG